MKTRDAGRLGARRRDRTMEEWQRKLARSEERMRRLRELDAPDVVIADEQKITDEAKRYLAKFDPTGAKIGNDDD